MGKKLIAVFVVVWCNGETQPSFGCGFLMGIAPLGWRWGLKGEVETASFAFVTVHSQFIIQHL